MKYRGRNKPHAGLTKSSRNHTCDQNGKYVDMPELRCIESVLVSSETLNLYVTP